MKIVIVGTGYVGLISGVSLALQGNQVTCIDKNKKIVDQLNSCVPTIYEKGLSEALSEVVVTGKFKASTDLNSSINKTDLVIIAVGTPTENNKIDLSQLETVLKEISTYIKKTTKYISIVVKSTVVPGTTDTYVRKVIEKYSGKKFPQFGLGMNPEFLREGQAFHDFTNPDRIVIGYEDIKTKKILDRLYKPWKVKKIFVNSRTAELIKYANNALLATQISSMNEIANLAYKIGDIDIKNVYDGVVSDKRWLIEDGDKSRNPEIVKYLMPGCGFGGSCFGKDLKALVNFAKINNVKMNVATGVLEANDNQPDQVIKIIQDHLKGRLNNKKIMMLGLSFKPETDDVRDSSSISIIKSLIKLKCNLYVHDPIAIDNFKKIKSIKHEKINYIKNYTEYINDVEIIIINTAWKQYKGLRKIDLSKKIIFDSRRIFNNLQCEKYLTIGRRIL